MSSQGTGTGAGGQSVCVRGQPPCWPWPGGAITVFVGPEARRGGAGRDCDWEEGGTCKETQLAVSPAPGFSGGKGGCVFVFPVKLDSGCLYFLLIMK